MARYCGIALYLSNASCHCAAPSGGRTPSTGCHSVMERPDSVRRVMPPITTMRNIMAQQARSQRAIGRVAAASGEAAAGKTMEDTSACGCFTKFQAGLTA
jgi:hypothetical protein